MSAQEPQEPAGIQIRNLREAKGWSQDVLATHLRCDRSLVAHWESGKRLPKATTFKKILYVLQPKPNNGQGNLAVTVTKAELSGILLELERAGKDELDSAIALCSYSYLRVLTTLILAASGQSDTAIDVRSVDLYFKHRKELVEEKRLQSSEAIVNVTPKSKAWSAGDNVYAKPSKSAESPPDRPESDGASEPTNGTGK